MRHFSVMLTPALGHMLFCFTPSAPASCNSRWTISTSLVHKTEELVNPQCGFFLFYCSVLSGFVKTQRPDTNCACAAAARSAVLCCVFGLFSVTRLSLKEPIGREGIAKGGIDACLKKKRKKSKGDYCSSARLQQGFLQPWITQQCQHGPLT